MKSCRVMEYTVLCPKAYFPKFSSWRLKVVYVIYSSFRLAPRKGRLEIFQVKIQLVDSGYRILEVDQYVECIAE